jgi:hypothetical protein
MLLRSGMGAVDFFGHCTGILNPFNAVSPDCWALQFPELLSPINVMTGSNITPQQLQNPSQAYSGPTSPGAPGVVPGGLLTTPVPIAPGIDFQAALDAAIAAEAPPTIQPQPGQPDPNAPGFCSSTFGTGPMAVSFCANPLPWILGGLGAVVLLPALLSNLVGARP